MNEFHSERAVGKSSLFLVQQNWTSQVALVLKNLPTMQETWVQSLGREDPLEKAMATHSSILAWSIPRTEDPGGIQPMVSQRVRHDWSDWAYVAPTIGWIVPHRNTCLWHCHTNSTYTISTADTHFYRLAPGKVQCTVSHPAYGDEPPVNRQVKLRLEEGVEVGDGRAGRFSAIRHRGKAAVSLMPDINGVGSVSLPHSIPSTLLKKWSSDVWVLCYA